VTKRNAEAAENVEDASVLNETGDAPETRAWGQELHRPRARDAERERPH
jgi:hypothetical protein